MSSLSRHTVGNAGGRRASCLLLSNAIAVRENILNKFDRSNIIESLIGKD